ncbi:DUF3124 domain-containing protein [Pinisolibacter aquiterrae]|uniref:DUF3124 domain-containing protein n=1 Tax=Pinisolibacter aquiterrae TaxID=2815579 RepID=UPI001C3DE64D|nr:DUF3124 domain-containing protein [Pinisolibacter aquiterrae]MBV5262590.1 DUF3124 domain-containing protein [Pinisolibacter aquiterrae]MCC8237042.1 DUF3124 domain-containing protein [Pinisolibacter aquiterrae]
MRIGRGSAGHLAAALLSAGMLAGAAAQEAAGPAKVPPAIAAFGDAIQPGPASLTGLHGRTYVPVYSSVMAIGGSTRIDFSVTLSIHNGSSTRPITIERIDYYDTAGKLVEEHLPEPVAIRPYGTIQVVVGQPDTRGGLGANFIVDWTSPTASIEPIIEAVMLSSHGTQGYSFSSVGRKVER